MPQVYFLCTGNSCRSQMAEGWARQLLGPDWRIASAGVEVHGLNPVAVQVMAEAGVDISHQTSTLIDPDYLRTCDLVITLCGDARDRCPVTPATVSKRHWPLPDPAQATGTAADRLAVFRQVRDELRRRVAALAQEAARG
ncbi:arsenate reductase (thioredoxin) [Levilactobacillus spicheri]|uniref:Arsenate reductase (Thioredoxin) n=2 Tax=Levilactobacillus spicheri TaxID=216463 RepID=A0ABQ0WT63_9LACO|nr:arsenate reductase (thioredoxin) [Levilactobacillus spicheri]GEO67740.1 arsenate reductase (thioredoxin) [Levilactobacillus spicheri]